MSARSLVAAAARWTGRKFRQQQTQFPDQGWQNRAWQYYDEVPEVRFAARWVANAMGTARLIAGKRTDDGAVDPLPDEHPAAQAVAGIAGGPTGQSQLLKEFGPHLVVAGEGWIIIRPDDDRHDWRVLSVSEVTRGNNQLEAEIDGEKIVVPGDDPDNTDPDAPVAIRVWEPHPRRHIEADSPVRSSLGLLEELRLLNAAVAAIARSRLTGRGVLLVPHGTRFPSTGQPGDQGEDDLIEVFMTVAETAYKEPESAAATVPIILEVPGETIGQFQRITFESDFDEIAIKLREEAIRRWATGMEIPAEIVLGLGDANHWSAWALQAEAIRLGIEPRLATVADALTTQWLRPLLEADNVADADELLVWYDTSPLRVYANRSQTAIEVHDRGAISDAALRRETGFDESDAPGTTERTARGEQTPTRRELPVDETQALPDTMPASALGRLGDLGRDLVQRIQARHGLDDDQTRELVEALAKVATAGGRVSPDTALLYALTMAAYEEGGPDA